MQEQVFTEKGEEKNNNQDMPEQMFMKKGKGQEIQEGKARLRLPVSSR
jgi:hypothetical protein